MITDSIFKLVECCNDNYTCKIHQQCPTRDPLITLHNKIRNFFEETTLLSIIKETNFNFHLKESDHEIANLS